MARVDEDRGKGNELRRGKRRGFATHPGQLLLHRLDDTGRGPLTDETARDARAADQNPGDREDRSFGSDLVDLDDPSLHCHEIAGQGTDSQSP